MVICFLRAGDDLSRAISVLCLVSVAVVVSLVTLFFMMMMRPLLSNCGLVGVGMRRVCGL